MPAPRRVLRRKRAVPHEVETPAARPRLTVVPVPRQVPPPRIAMGTASWGAMSQVAIREQARKSGHENYLRLFFFALADANRLGHAEYEPGALRAALATVDRTTGDVKTPTEAAVSKALRKARDLGLLAPESNARCLVLSPRLFQRGTGGNACAFHGINVKPSTPRP
jgi:hypothetical protein